MGECKVVVDLLITIIILMGIVAVVPLILFIRVFFHDQKQREHSILRNYPVLGKMRYILEKMGPELRQYLFNNNNEGKPFNRGEFEYVYKAAKDRKSTRLNSSHVSISYAVFCLKKKNEI